MTTFTFDETRAASNLAGNALPSYDASMAVEIDPYPVYARYRHEDPVHWGPAHDPRLPGMWYLFRFADCQTLFKLGINSPAPIGGMPSKLGWDFDAGVPDDAVDYFELRKRFFTAQDPPDHRRIRTVIGRFFTPKRIADLRPRIETLVTELIDDILADPSGEIDLVARLASPLPLILMSEIMGVPAEDRDLVHEMSLQLSSGFEVNGTFDELLVAGDAARQFKAYLDTLFERKRRTANNDVISVMIDAADATGSMSELELYAAVSVLIQGGYASTVGLLGRGTLGLLEQHDQFDRLIEQPEALALPATDELLRWTSPAQKPPPRWVYDDIVISGKVIRRGEVVQPMVGSANRDDATFAEPDRIDITRQVTSHLAFGGGIHRCVGATLARLQGEIVFRELARRLPDLTVSDVARPQYLQRRTIRALERLPVIPTQQ